MRYSDWLDTEFRSHRVRAFLLGIPVGLLVGVGLCTVIGYMLDTWRVTKIREACIAEYGPIRAELGECKDIVERFGQTDYDEVVKLYRERHGR